MIATLKVRRQVDDCGDMYETVCDLLIDGSVVETDLSVAKAEKRALELNLIYTSCITQVKIEMPVGGYEKVVYLLGMASII